MEPVNCKNLNKPNPNKPKSETQDREPLNPKPLSKSQLKLCFEERADVHQSWAAKCLLGLLHQGPAFPGLGV